MKPATHYTGGNRYAEQEGRRVQAVDEGCATTLGAVATVSSTRGTRKVVDSRNFATTPAFHVICYSKIADALGLCLVSYYCGIIELAP